jgi:hypothetical protein
MIWKRRYSILNAIHYYYYYYYYPSLREQPAASVDSVLFNMLGVLTYYMRNQYDEFGLEMMRDNLSFYVRLQCSMSPQSPNLITFYAEHCIGLGIQLDDAIQLLQV